MEHLWLFLTKQKWHVLESPGTQAGAQNKDFSSASQTGLHQKFSSILNTGYVSRQHCKWAFVGKGVKGYSL